MSYVILGNDRQKKAKIFYDAKLIFWSFATFFVLTIFWSGAKQRFCFRESISVLNQNGRIQALGFLARWRLTSQALYYKIPYAASIFRHEFSHFFRQIAKCLWSLLLCQVQANPAGALSSQYLLKTSKKQLIHFLATEKLRPGARLSKWEIQQKSKQSGQFRSDFRLETVVTRENYLIWKKNVPSGPTRERDVYSVMNEALSIFAKWKRPRGIQQKWVSLNSFFLFLFFHKLALCFRST